MTNEILTIAVISKHTYFSIGLIFGGLWAAYIVGGGICRWVWLWMDDKGSTFEAMWPVNLLAVSPETGDQITFTFVIGIVGSLISVLAWPMVPVVALGAILAHAGRAIKRGQKAFKKHAEDPYAHKSIRDNPPR